MPPSAIERFPAAASEHGIESHVQTFPQDTRTAEHAATALGCEPGQIVKSLIFKADDELVLISASGSNRVDETKAAPLFGVEKLGKASADEARNATGFAIGGVPPCGHPSALRAAVDRDLLGWPSIWAAAGAPDAVFELTPETLVRITDARPADIALAT